MNLYVRVHILPQWSQIQLKESLRITLESHQLLSTSNKFKRISFYPTSCLLRSCKKQPIAVIMAQVSSTVSISFNLIQGWPHLLPVLSRISSSSQACPSSIRCSVKILLWSYSMRRLRRLFHWIYPRTSTWQPNALPISTIMKTWPISP